MSGAFLNMKINQKFVKRTSVVTLQLYVTGYEKRDHLGFFIKIEFLA